KDGRYDDAIGRLKGVRSRDLEIKKTVTGIGALYKLYRYSEGMDLLRKNISILTKESETKGLLRSTIEYLVSTDDIANIQIFGRYLVSAYPDEQDYVNYSTAGYYFREGNYPKAYASYSKLSADAAEYRTEVLFRMGIISELHYRNARAAAGFFQQLADSGESDEFVTAGKLELSLLYYEKGQKEQTQKLLRDVIGRKENVAAIIKASDILDYYDLDLPLMLDPQSGTAAQEGVQ
ncbi:MAG: tetratricopeptide repeat protein, partial [Spirochaetota bacterium]